MADALGAHSGEYSSNASSIAAPPNHLGTNVPSGQLDGRHDPEKTGHDDVPVAQDEEEDEDMDALIDDLESQDGVVEEEEEKAEPGGARIIPEDMLQTSTVTGLTDQEVIVRRKKYGMNQMKEEKENLILKFLGYFIGPIQFVMEVTFPTAFLLSSTFSSRISLHLIKTSSKLPEAHGLML